jgi:hypothetical protein
MTALNPFMKQIKNFYKPKNITAKESAFKSLQTNCKEQEADIRSATREVPISTKSEKSLS